MSSKGMLSGMRGVFLVAAELAQQGLVVSPTSRSAKGVDLLATNPNGSRTFAVEVKSSSGGAFWLVGKSAGEQASKNNIWVFVLLGKEKKPSRFFVVPSIHLAKMVRPGKTIPHVMKTSLLKYEDRWSVFGKA